MKDLTRAAIKAAMEKLLDQRPLSQITVKDIVSACGINRNTFYYHYQGIPELIAEIVNDDADAVIKSYPTLESLEDCLETVIRSAMDKKRAIFHIYNSASRDVYERYLWSTCGHVVGAYLDTVLNGRQLPATDRDLIHRYYTCIAYGCISYWLDSNMRDEVLEDIHRITELRRGSMEEMIARSLGER